MTQNPPIIAVEEHVVFPALSARINPAALLARGLPGPGGSTKLLEDGGRRVWRWATRGLPRWMPHGYPTSYQ